MEILSVGTLIGTLGLGVAIGMYISSQIEKHIDANMTNNEEIDTKKVGPTQIFKEDAIVKKIWSYTYKDENGNEIELPAQDSTGCEKNCPCSSCEENPTTTWNDDDEERQISCCGDDITDQDIKMCPTCLEHQ